MKHLDLLVNFIMMMAGGFLGLWLTEYESSLYGSSIFANPNTYLLISVVLVFSATTLSHEKSQRSSSAISSKLDSQNEISSALTHAIASIDEKVGLLINESAGFKVINNDELVSIAIKNLKRSKSMRVMASPKTDDINTKEYNSQAKYFKETEDFLRRNPMFQYRRICKEPEPGPFAEHLKKLYSLNHNNNIQVAFLAHNEIGVHYQIFDENFMLLGIRTENVPGVSRLNIIFTNLNKDIIRHFIQHFDSTWFSINHSK